MICQCCVVILLVSHSSEHFTSAYTHRPQRSKQENHLLHLSLMSYAHETKKNSSNIQLSGFTTVVSPSMTVLSRQKLLDIISEQRSSLQTQNPNPNPLPYQRHRSKYESLTGESIVTLQLSHKIENDMFILFMSPPQFTQLDGFKKTFIHIDISVFFLFFLHLCT